tara:strand:+ start:3950 stop:5023 length:1074 start_codon:yes stop_codon:yes gene_type:complete
MSYIPRSKYKIKYTQGDELVIRDTNVDYVGKYIELSTGKKYAGTDILNKRHVLINKAKNNLHTNRIHKSIDVLKHNVFQPNMQKFLEGVEVIPFAKSTPTQNDYNRGYYMRYFAKRINGSKYMEIDEKVHKKIVNRTTTYDWRLYEVGTIRWFLTGNVFKKNGEMIKKMERGHKGIFHLFPILNEFQLPDPEPTTNLFTEGNELFYADGTEYVGSYHIHPEKGPMEGAQHVEQTHAKLYYSNQLPNPSGINYQNFVDNNLRKICYKCNNGFPVSQIFTGVHDCPEGWTEDRNPCRDEPTSPTNPNLAARTTPSPTPTPRITRRSSYTPVSTNTGGGTSGGSSGGSTGGSSGGGGGGY